VMGAGKKYGVQEVFTLNFFC